VLSQCEAIHEFTDRLIGALQDDIIYTKVTYAKELIGSQLNLPH